MRYSLIALSTALAICSAAQAADVQVYGVVDVGLSYVRTDADNSSKTTNNFSMDNAREFGSRWGLRGSEDLGNGYKIGFVLESGFKSDTGELDQNGKLFGRESHIDLYTPAGTFSAGLIPVFGSVLGANGLFRAIDPLFANYTSAHGSGYFTASRWTRADNALSYVSPSLGGVTGYLMYSFKDSASAVGDEGKSTTDRYAAAALRYINGPAEAVMVADTTMYGSARTGAKANQNDGWTVTLGGNYKLDNGIKFLAFGQLFENQELNTTVRAGALAGGVNSATNNSGYGFVDGWGAGLGIHLPAGGGVAKASVGYRDMDNKSGYDFTRWVVSAGYDYAITKRTAIYAMTGWTQEKIENSGAESRKPSAYEVNTGIVHRF